MPWKKEVLMKKQYAVQISSSESEVRYKSTDEKRSFWQEAEQNSIDTMDKMLNFVCKKYSSRLCLGTRQILSMKNEISPDSGKVWKKYNMGGYEWMTYDQMFQKSFAFGRGLKELGYPPKTNIIIYADTRGDSYLSNMFPFIFIFMVFII